MKNPILQVSRYTSLELIFPLLCHSLINFASSYSKSWAHFQFTILILLIIFDVTKWQYWVMTLNNQSNHWHTWKTENFPVRKTFCLHVKIVCSKSRPNMAEWLLIETLFVPWLLSRRGTLIFPRRMHCTYTWNTWADFCSTYFWKRRCSVPNRNKSNQWPLILIHFNIFQRSNCFVFPT